MHFKTALEEPVGSLPIGLLILPVRGPCLALKVVAPEEKSSVLDWTAVAILHHLPPRRLQPFPKVSRGRPLPLPFLWSRFPRRQTSACSTHPGSLCARRRLRKAETATGGRGVAPPSSPRAGSGQQRGFSPTRFREASGQSARLAFCGCRLGPLGSRVLTPAGPEQLCWDGGRQTTRWLLCWVPRAIGHTRHLAPLYPPAAVATDRTRANFLPLPALGTQIFLTGFVGGRLRKACTSPLTSAPLGIDSLRRRQWRPPRRTKVAMSTSGHGVAVAAFRGIRSEHTASAGPGRRATTMVCPARSLVSMELKKCINGYW